MMHWKEQLRLCLYLLLPKPVTLLVELAAGEGSKDHVNKATKTAIPTASSYDVIHSGVPAQGRTGDPSTYLHCI